jgi:hypothetical protein
MRPTAGVPSIAVAHGGWSVAPPPWDRASAHHRPNHPSDEEHTTMADKSPRQHQSKKSGKSLKEKRTEKKGKQATKRLGS